MQPIELQLMNQDYKSYFNLDLKKLHENKNKHIQVLLLNISYQFNDYFFELTREEQIAAIKKLLIDLDVNTSNTLIKKFISSYFTTKKIEEINKIYSKKIKNNSEQPIANKITSKKKLKEIKLNTFQTDKKEDIINFILSLFILFYLFQVEETKDIINSFFLILLSLYIYCLKYEHIAKRELKGFNHFFIIIRNIIQNTINYLIKKIN